MGWQDGREERMTNTLNRKSIQQIKREHARAELKATAHHEAGHAFMAYAFGYKFDYVTIEPDGHSAGHLSTIYEETVYWHDILIKFAGHVAEMEFGYSARYWDWFPDGGREDYSKALSSALEWVPGRNVDRIVLLRSLLGDTKDIIDDAENWRMIESLANALIKNKTMEYGDVDRLFRRLGKRLPGFLAEGQPEDLVIPGCPRRRICSDEEIAPYTNAEKEEQAAYRSAGQAFMCMNLNVPFEFVTDEGVLRANDIDSDKNLMIEHAGLVADQMCCGLMWRVNPFMHATYRQLEEQALVVEEREAYHKKRLRCDVQELLGNLEEWVLVSEIAMSLLALPKSRRVLSDIDCDKIAADFHEGTCIWQPSKRDC